MIGNTSETRRNVDAVSTLTENSNGSSYSSPRLDEAEKEILEELAEMDVDDDEVAKKVHQRLVDDVKAFKAVLLETRNSMIEKNQKELDSNVEKLQKDRDIENEKAELELVKQFQEYC